MSKNTEPKVTMNDLLRMTRRLRPDRIVIGEVRGGGTLAMLKAWNTGHPGGVATIHAGGAQDALHRLGGLISEVSRVIPHRSIASAINLAAFVERVAAALGRRVTSQLVTSFSRAPNADCHIATASTAWQSKMCEQHPRSQVSQKPTVTKQNHHAEIGQDCQIAKISKMFFKSHPRK